MNQVPPQLSRRKTVQFLVLMTLLAWATQTLLAQWGYGGAVQPRFLPPAPTPERIEVRGEAVVVGAEVRLRQLCRFSREDSEFARQFGDLVIQRFTGRASERQVSLSEIRDVLSAAGANPAALHFAGALSCRVRRSDAPASPSEWPVPVATVAKAPASGEQPLPADSEVGESLPANTLKSLLLQDLAYRLSLNPADLQLSFQGPHAGVANLVESQVQFDFEPVRARNLGPVHWNLTLRAPGGDEQQLRLQAHARAWFLIPTAQRHLQAGQVLSPSDVVARRVLLDRLPEPRPMPVERIVGQQASRDIPAGATLTATLLKPVELARPGQLITVLSRRGGVQVQSVMRCLDSGSRGEMVRVRNEATRQNLHARLVEAGVATVSDDPALHAAADLAGSVQP
jgi:flagella basal body P-ring formation protein FlgA